jgi:hypothetical protein
VYSFIGQTIDVRGTSDADGTTSLTETVSGKTTGSFRGSLASDGAFFGTWSDPKGNAHPFALLAVSLPPDGGTPARPVRDGGNKPFSDVDAALAKDETEPLAVLTRGEEKTSPRSCNAWARASRAGFVDMEPSRLSSGGHAKVHCRTLALVKNALPAKDSFIDDLRLGDDLPALFPADFPYEPSPDESARLGAAAAKGQSWKAAAPMSRAELGKDYVRYQQPHQMGMMIRFEAFGDFDADGIEDVLVSTADYATEGTLSVSRLVLLTRPRKDTLFRVIHQE